MILPAVIAGGLMAFTLSLDDFIVAFMTTGRNSRYLFISGADSGMACHSK